MNFSKVLPLLILSIFLFNGVAAVTSYASWGNDEAQTATITNGESISFTADFFSMRPPMNLRVELYDSTDTLLYTFLSQSASTNEYVATYTIDSTMYKNIGDFSVILNGNDGSSAQSHEITLKVNAPTPVTPTADTTAPVITITGSNPLSITQGSVYTDAGATASDNVDGDITSRITVLNNVNANVVGTYTVTYSVSDTAKNSATATRTVNVVAASSTPVTPVTPTADTTAPVITIVYPNQGHTITSKNIEVEVTTNEDATVRLRLDDGTLRTMSGNNHVFTYTLSGLDNGEHTIDFTATDTAGNSATSSVTFEVKAHKKSSGHSGRGSGFVTEDSTSTSSNKGNIAVFPTGDVKILDEKKTENVSFFQKIINAVSNFFKWLFGMK